tara:strand:+ start:115 stop:351 length:237 start_codon:yes stop_codon:yes gene_type:complete
MNKETLQRIVKEEIQKEIFSSNRPTQATPESVANDLKIIFAIAFESGLESLGSYDDFEDEFWIGNLPEIILRLEKLMK